MRKEEEHTKSIIYSKFAILKNKNKALFTDSPTIKHLHQASFITHNRQLFLNSHRLLIIHSFIHSFSFRGSRMRLQKNTRLAPINEVSLICRQLRRSLRVGENAEKGLPSSFILKHHFHHDVVIDIVRLVLEERGEGFKIRHLAWGDGLVWGAVAHVMPDVMKREFGAHELVYQWDVFVFVVVDKMLDCGAGLAPDVCDEVERHGCRLLLSGDRITCGKG